MTIQKRRIHCGDTSMTACGQIVTTPTKKVKPAAWHDVAPEHRCKKCAKAMNWLLRSPSTGRPSAAYVLGSPC